MSESEDIPIIVHGGPQMVIIEIRRSSKKNGPVDKFSVQPEDPNVPFKEVVVSDGNKVVLRLPLNQGWKVEIK